MIKEGLLDKYGKPNEKTPSSWFSSYVDYNLPATDKPEVQQLARKVSNYLAIFPQFFLMILNLN